MLEYFADISISTLFNPVVLVMEYLEKYKKVNLQSICSQKTIRLIEMEQMTIATDRSLTCPPIN